MRISDCSSDVCSSDLLHATVQVSLPALIFIPFAARIGPLAWSRWLPPLHAGLGARFASSVRRVDLAIWLFILLGTCWRSEEHTSELQSLMRISYAVFCLKKKNN